MMNFRRKRKSNTKVEDIDITSLLDILVILLVFLLKNFTDSDLTVDMAKELALPYATQRGVAQQGVVVQVSSSSLVYYNNQLIGPLSSDSNIDQLKSLLNNHKAELDLKLDAAKKSEPKLINLVFDQSLTYETVNQILTIAADSGFGMYKLIVQGDE